MEQAQENKMQAQAENKAPDAVTGASFTVGATSPAGFRCTLELSGPSGGDVLARGSRALAWLQDQGFTPGGPVRSEVPPEAGTRSPGDDGEGVLEDDNGPYKLCPVHQGAKMRQRVHGDQKWYSHRLESGAWCKGKPAK